jgi:hypothetical protein
MLYPVRSPQPPPPFPPHIFSILCPFSGCKCFGVAQRPHTRELIGNGESFHGVAILQVEDGRSSDLATATVNLTALEPLDWMVCRGAIVLRCIMQLDAAGFGARQSGAIHVYQEAPRCPCHCRKPQNNAACHPWKQARVCRHDNRSVMRSDQYTPCSLWALVLRSRLFGDFVAQLALEASALANIYRCQFAA